MSDESAQEPTEEQQKDPAWYREQLERKDQQLAEQQKEANKLKVKLLERSFKDVGLDPNKGIGKAVAEKYDGDPDPDAIRNFAIDEYQWEPPQDDTMQGEVRAAQQRVSQTVTEAESQPTQEIDLQIAQAEEAGNFPQAMSLKLQKYRQEQGI